MTATSRKVARTALATLLRTALVGTGLPTQKVLAAPPAGGITTSPLVLVKSAGTLPKRQGVGQTKGYNRFKFEIFIYVMATSAEGGPTPDESADALDDIEAGVRTVLLTNNTNPGNWTLLDLPENFSNIYRLKASDTGGKPYDVEVIPVEMEVYDT